MKKKQHKLVLSTGGITITLFNKWLITLFAKKISEKELIELLKKG